MIVNKLGVLDAVFSREDVDAHYKHNGTEHKLKLEVVTTGETTIRMFIGMYSLAYDLHSPRPSEIIEYIEGLSELYLGVPFASLP